ncbi:globin domain-containing protein [Micromonospora eburnea]|uniref:nitric oxide dioxygenase n=1 Tax=Micromonospora eburnea TaxID=227316 RepID=A0A1C6UBD5_9ACTN|nr:globin domain-containing protein [Micromonospora eburnea]SCL51264.1 NAD(P)H-flavin reductase [Micromonospora eburnea]
MSKCDHAYDYHDLLGLHHSMLLRRKMRGDGPAPYEGQASAGALLATWPQRADDQRLLRESLALLEPLTDALTYLYAALFRDGPHLRSLFPDSLAAQRDRLAWSVRQLIDGLDQPENVVSLFQELGRAHRKLGVRASHYQPFGTALMEALRAYAGTGWRPEHDDAWSRAYQFLAGVMSNAATGELSAPPFVRGTVVHHELRGPDLAVLRVRTAEPYDYRAGQYATVGAGQLPHTWRSYSIANPPSGDGVLEFHVRATGAGRLSDVLVHRTAVGDVLRLGPARGATTLAATSDSRVLLVAGGTGLAAIRALLGELAGRVSPPATWLFFGARTRDDLYDLESLHSFAGRLPWLHVVLAVSDGDAGPYEPGTVVDAVTRYGDWAGHDAYLAGPSTMVTELAHRLVDLGVEPHRIRYDRQ